MVRTSTSTPDTLPDTSGISDLLASARLDAGTLGSDGEDSTSVNAEALGSAGKSAVLSSFLSALGNAAYRGGVHRLSRKHNLRSRARWEVQLKTSRDRAVCSPIMIVLTH